jgi:shikimate dehydrogenase
MTIGEIVMKHDITSLVAAARGKGCRTVLGREMLREQLPLYLEFLELPPVEPNLV